MNDEKIIWLKENGFQTANEYFTKPSHRRMAKQLGCAFIAVLENEDSIVLSNDLIEELSYDELIEYVEKKKEELFGIGDE